MPARKFWAASGRVTGWSSRQSIRTLFPLPLRAIREDSGCPDWEDVREIKKDTRYKKQTKFK
jgi:hypothetical protein